VDLRLLDALPSAAEQAAVDAVLGPPVVAFGGASGAGGAGGAGHGAVGADGGRELGRAVRGGHELRARRDLLLPALHALNDRVGWISRGGLNYVCDRLDVAPAEAYGVASFYAWFSLRPRRGRQVHVCTDLACLLAGADPRPAAAEGAIASPCLGLCDQAPAALVVEPGDPPSWSVEAGAPEPAVSGPVLLSRVGRVDPTSLDSYLDDGGFAALRRAVELGPEAVVAEVVASRLVGRGGAAFPASRKWEAVARHPNRPHLLVANADESEPGTFKDRVLMEHDPFAVVESIAIAAFATGCERAFLYVRAEYPRVRERLQHAIDASVARGLLPAGLAIEIRRGAGAYICGEETAIFNSIEGGRGEPRSKPPFPVDVGLFGRPTLVHNIETLANVLPIVLHGGEAFARVGTGDSTGTKLFCLSGHVARPGVYEVPFGTTLRSLLETAGASSVRAVLLGGAAGAFVGPDELEVPLTFAGTRAIGATLGSGVVMVLDERVDLDAFLLRIAEFFRDESCGQCVPCRVGTVRQEEALHRRDRATLADVGRVMQDASICGLGQTAHNAIASAVAKLGALS
jgi:NADH-quinone oxidoreductase subunit F